MKQQYEKTHNPDIDPIEYKDFFAVMNEMNQVFINITAPGRIKLYYSAIKDLPLVALKDIAIKFMSSSRQMPLPSDFRDAAKEWLKANKVYVHDEQSVPIECKHCLDLGVNYLTKIESGEFYGLMRCDCKTHVTQDLHAPTWDNALYQTFKRQPCPMNWFKPKDVEEFTLTNGEINNLITQWKITKRNAEQFWKDLGFK